MSTLVHEFKIRVDRMVTDAGSADRRKKKGAYFAGPIWERHKILVLKLIAQLPASERNRTINSFCKCFDTCYVMSNFHESDRDSLRSNKFRLEAVLRRLEQFDTNPVNGNLPTTWHTAKIAKDSPAGHKNSAQASVRNLIAFFDSELERKRPGRQRDAVFLRSVEILAKFYESLPRKLAFSDEHWQWILTDVVGADTDDAVWHYAMTAHAIASLGDRRARSFLKVKRAIENKEWEKLEPLF